MDLNCAVTSDLLPLYLEGLCCEETNALVEAHLAGCESCREKHRRMTEGPVLESTVPEVEQPDRQKPLNVKRVLKRIRRRWTFLLLCALMVVPVTLLSVNQALGTGLSFTAIPYVLEIRAFLSAVNAEDYEKAFSMVDVTGEYESSAIPLYNDFSEHPLARYQEIELGGESYYVTDEIYSNEYADYLRDGDEERFWLSQLLFKESMHDRYLLIPEKIMPLIEKSMEKDEELYQTLKDYLSGFILIEGGAGRYYMDGSIPKEELASPDSVFSILPVFYYNQAARNAGQDIEEMNEFSAGYADLGLEIYQELSYTAFVENLESLDREGTKITSQRLTDIYEINGIYHITYAVKLKVNRRPVDGVSLEFIIGKNGINKCILQKGDNDSLPDISLVRYYSPGREK